MEILLNSYLEEMDLRPSGQKPLRRQKLFFKCQPHLSDNASVSGSEHKHSVPVFPMQPQMRAAA